MKPRKNYQAQKAPRTPSGRSGGREGGTRRSSGKDSNSKGWNRGRSRLLGFLGRRGFPILPWQEPACSVAVSSILQSAPVLAAHRDAAALGPMGLGSPRASLARQSPTPSDIWQDWWVGGPEMARRLRALLALSDRPGLLPSTHRGASPLSVTPVRGSDAHVWLPQALQACYAQTHRQAKHPYT